MDSLLVGGLADRYSGLSTLLAIIDVDPIGFMAFVDTRTSKGIVKILQGKSKLNLWYNIIQLLKL